jgi:hypothetical protein
MAFSWVDNAHRLSTSQDKILRLRMVNADAIQVTTATLAFAGNSLPALTRSPTEYFITEVTAGNANLAPPACISIEGFTTAANGTVTGITFTKCSIAGGAMNRDFDVYIHTRPFDG